MSCRGARVLSCYAVLLQSFPSDTSQPDMPGDRFFTVAIIGQHSAAYPQDFCRTVQGQIVCMHPVPNALVTDAAGLLYRKVAQVVSCQINFAIAELNRTPPFTYLGGRKKTLVL